MSAFAESFLLGLVQSLHCATMCGPLASCVGGSGAVTWHAGRAASYAAAGVALGSLGSGLGTTQLASPGAVAALILAAGLLVTTVFGERVLAIPGFGRIARPLLGAVMRLPLATRGLALGAVSVLLPCGLLWLALAAAAVSGGPVQGAVAMLGFVLGSLPLLVGAQLGLAAVPAPIRRLLPLVACALLVWRAWSGLWGHSCCS